jgi:hypothetical protein
MRRTPRSDSEVIGAKALAYIGLLLSVAFIINIIAIARALPAHPSAPTFTTDRGWP